MASGPVHVLLLLSIQQDCVLLIVAQLYDEHHKPYAFIVKGSLC